MGALLFYFPQKSHSILFYHSHYNEDIDECLAGTHSCSTGSKCINRVGGFSCQCLKGYQLTGGVCIGKPSLSTWESFM